MLNVAIYEVLGSSSSRDMQMGGDVQNEKTAASLTVCSLGLLRDGQRGKCNRRRPRGLASARGLLFALLSFLLASRQSSREQP
jgi:hypothetical protein